MTGAADVAQIWHTKHYMDTDKLVSSLK